MERGQGKGKVAGDHLVTEALEVRLGENLILKGVNLTVIPGEIVALLGPSGSGKTTLLRAVAGLVKPSGGRIALGEELFFEGARGVFLPPERRNLGLVFQSYALWPHRTVYENVAYGLRLRRVPEPEVRERVLALLDRLGLTGLERRYPGALSGGQQQRVSLARALAYDPKLLLLDEPLSNLDAKLRDQARVWLREALKATGKAALFVTHDQAEAMALADRIALLHEGRIEQIDTPEELYRNPKTLFVADFLGNPNVVEALVVGLEEGLARLELAGFPFRARAMGTLTPGRLAKLVLRPEALRPAGPGEVNVLEGELAHSLYLGSHYEHWVRVGEALLRFLSPYPLGELRLRLALDPEAALAYPS
ncbi:MULTISPECIES: ABC transporter ATP-binding protein [unclassified Meiothermus]|uniref:ABC transporter ATP-binding protein n=1 Tax=unclassified Meiothermus TaxID=370471 RepID=UPI001F34F467|nr:MULTISPECIES: ABC transporter ATP-binding protein [unclassified Meiothermus]